MKISIESRNTVETYNKHLDIQMKNINRIENTIETYNKHIDINRNNAYRIESIQLKHTINI
jgi:hypothetical protein